MTNQETTANETEQQQQTLADFGLRVDETMTTPSRPGKKPRPVWIVRGNIFGLEEFFRDIDGRKFRGAWSFFENPSETILKHVQTNGRQSFAEQVESETQRKLEKAERYETYAANAEARAKSRYQAANEIGSAIPFGQPILVGHHSERRHRRDIERISQNMRKSVEESEKAEYLKDRAHDLSNAEARLSNRRYVGNRVKDAQKEVNKLSKWMEPTNPRLVHAQEKLTYWNSRLAEVEAAQKDKGHAVASPETIKVGDLIDSLGSWLPVVRVNKKTVTVSHWLGVPTLHNKIEYTRIKKFQSKA